MQICLEQDFTLVPFVVVVFLAVSVWSKEKFPDEETTRTCGYKDIYLWIAAPRDGKWVPIAEDAMHFSNRQGPGTHVQEPTWKPPPWGLSRNQKAPCTLPKEERSQQFPLTMIPMSHPNNQQGTVTQGHSSGTQTFAVTTSSQIWLKNHLRVVKPYLELETQLPTQC